MRTTKAWGIRMRGGRIEVEGLRETKSAITSNNHLLDGEKVVRVEVREIVKPKRK